MDFIFEKKNIPKLAAQSQDDSEVTSGFAKMMNMSQSIAKTSNATDNNQLGMLDVVRGCKSCIVK